MNKVGIFVHSRWSAAGRLAAEVNAFLNGKVDEVWQTNDWDDAAIAAHIPGQRPPRSASAATAPCCMRPARSFRILCRFSASTWGAWAS